MPTLLEFYGITITMNFIQHEHMPPHVHANYAEYNATIEIESLKVTGNLPVTQLDKAVEWVKNNKEILLEIWDTQIFELNTSNQNTKSKEPQSQISKH